MSDVLAEILAHKATEVEQARRAHPVEEWQRRPAYSAARRGFCAAVTRPRAGRPNLIAEIKRSSPSAGLIQPDFDPVAIARQYAAGGADALSVLTDERYFDGRLEYLAAVKTAVALPVLRKDFLIDAYQVHEAAAAGADAVLLIADALDDAPLAELADVARRLALDVLLEVHSRARLPAALNVIRTWPAGVVLGINNRDLQAQRIDLATTEQLARELPPGLPFVTESGIKTRADVERLHAAGACALLVGETLMRSGDPAATIRELLG
jgi:indole-3-glycerol phosphate synthase